MLNLFCFFDFCLIQWKQTQNNIASYGENFYYLTYQGKIQNLKGYMFKKFFTIKNIWDWLTVFTQETIYHVHTEMRQNLNLKMAYRHCLLQA